MCNTSKPSLIQLQLIRMLDYLNQNVEDKKCCFKRHMMFRKVVELLVCSGKT
jgi:hypothetical protein